MACRGGPLAALPCPASLLACLPRPLLRVSIQLINQNVWPRSGAFPSGSFVRCPSPASQSSNSLSVACLFILYICMADRRYSELFVWSVVVPYGVMNSDDRTRHSSASMAGGVSWPVPPNCLKLPFNMQNTIANMQE